MNLYLIRHAEAAPRGQAGIQKDEDRPLTDAGRQQARELAGAFQRNGVQFETLVTSPLLRAVQTAEEMARVLGIPADRVVQSEHLAPGGARKKLAKFLQGLGGGSKALVGHQPDIEDLTGWLIGSKKAMIEFAKAGAACVNANLELAKGCGALVWLLTPQWVSERPAAPAVAAPKPPKGK
jgi:phosphohistidine phosphatase